jgi:hypothetical protein
LRIAFVAAKSYNAGNPVLLKEAIMKYLGHFSFVGYCEDEISHGLLSAVVSADDIDSATVQFHTLLDQKKSEAGLFDRLTFIFLEDIIEIRQFPEEGFIAHCIRFEGKPLSFKSRSIPGITSGVCKSFRLDTEFAAGDEQAVREIVPFMTIER